MKQRFLLLCLVLLSLVDLSAQTFPTTSTNGNEVWYYIQSAARSTDANAKWLCGGADGTIITNAVFSRTDESLLWKVVQNAGGIALVNKKNGAYLNSDVTYNSADLNTSVLPCVAVAPTTGLKLVPYVDQVAVPNGFYLVDKDATTVDNSANTTPKFQFYSAGAGSTYRPINYGTGTPNVNSSIRFWTPRTMLQTALTASIAYKNSTTAGTGPGQFTQDDIDALQSIIELAQAVYDDGNSTPADLYDVADELNAVMLMVGSRVIMPNLSSETEEFWYYIRGTRYPNTYLTAGAVGSEAPATNLALVPNDFQLWKFVPNTNGVATGFAIVNKATGEYIDTDQTRVMNMISTMPTNNLRFIPHTTYINNTLLFRVENCVGSTPVLRMHSDADSKAIVNWTGDANITSDWLFVSSDDVYRTQFLAALSDAHTAYTNSLTTAEGDEFGQYKTSARTTFAAAIAVADALHPASMTKDELNAAKATIVAAINAYAVNSDVATLSSATKLKWFRFVNAMVPSNGYAAGKAMTSNGRVLDQAYTYETVDAVSDAQLFRFVLNADGTKATTLINKANGNYVSATGTIVAAPTDANEFEITALDGFSFWIKPTTKSPIHAAASNSDIVNWNAGAGSASAWKIVYVKSEPVTTDLNPAYTAALTQTRNYYNITTGGAEYGQYPVAARSAFNAVIANQESKTQAELTNQQLAEGIDALSEASVLYKASINNTPDANKWYSLESAKVPGKFLTVDPATLAITCDVKNNSDNQKFRFVGKPSSGTYKNLNEIICKSVPTGSIRCENDAWDIVYNTGLNFSGGATALTLGYWPWNMTLVFGANGTQTLLQSLDGDGVGTSDGTTVINSIESYNGASAWKITVSEGESAVTVPTTNSDISITVKHRMIVVTGSNAPVKAYTTSGTEVDATKSLNPGIYIVKVASKVVKVNVQ